MASKFFEWLKPRGATLAELQEQHRHAVTAYEATQAATALAQDGFDNDGSASAEKALHAARDAERSAFEHLGRSERLLAAGELAEKEREREANERKAAELARAIADRSRATEIEAATATAAAAFVDALLAERANNAARRQLQHELDAVRIALGNPARSVSSHEFDIEPHLHVVAGQLEDLALGTGNDDPRGSWLRKIAALLSPGHMHHHTRRAAE
jgi:phage/plasmid-associated DNA primase